MEPKRKSPTKKKRVNHFKKQKVQYVSFAEFRQMQRIKERSHLGPGDTEFLTPFGSDKKNPMTWGGKTDFKN